MSPILLQDDTRLLTAAGDQRAALWDTWRAVKLGSFVGHEGSVKSIRPWAACEDVFASGARDGRVFLWDSRVTARYNEVSGANVFAPVVRIKVRCLESRFMARLVSCLRVRCLAPV